MDVPGGVVFELGAEGQWLRLAPSDGEDESGAERAPIGDPTAATSEEPSPSLPPDLEVASDAPDSVPDELPDPGPLESARQWLRQLPIVRHEVPAEGAAPASPGGDRGGWIRIGPRSLKAFGEAWERRPDGVVFLGNARMRDLLGETRAIRPSIRVVASGIDWFTVSAEWHAEGLSLTEADLKKLRTARTRFVKLASGWVSRDWVQTSETTAEMLADLGIEVGAGEQRVSIPQLAQARPESVAALEGLGGDPETVRAVQRL